MSSGLGEEGLGMEGLQEMVYQKELQESKIKYIPTEWDKPAALSLE